ncbi:MAG: pyridoxamine 5'-phosphate oxidase [Acidobacteria bacterium]|nr:pyridoxamine 5'-phosphate oxidase [Acidobacteriota bacterium]MCZ6876763.1 pyridoxamine 5'-phosphate oxidase [Acidobacteriota bacterium]
MTQDKSPLELPLDLTKRKVDPNPFKQFARWFEEGAAAEPILPEAVTLATASKDGKPSSRVVLLKKFDESGFVFYTNYQSRKGTELAENPQAALCFYWRQLERQISVTGIVTQVSREESEAYFRTRPRGSQLGALASRQSQVTASREVLEKRFEQVMAQYSGKEIPLPSYWGGYRLAPSTIEFWQGRPDRMHDRLRYSRQSGSRWKIERLAP